MEKKIIKSCLIQKNLIKKHFQQTEDLKSKAIYTEVPVAKNNFSNGGV